MGNTCVKVAPVEGWDAPPSPARRVRVVHAGRRARALAELLEVSERFAGLPWAMGSVHGLGEELARALEERGRPPVAAYFRGDRFPLATSVRAPERVGVDRLAAAAAAYRRGGAAVVVDAGTAVTVDWIDASGCFRGGAIVPGRDLAARALHHYTDRLPAIQPWDATDFPELPGEDTEEAIRGGLDVGMPALVDALAQKLEEAAGGAVRRWLTGGDAAWYRRRSRLSFTEDPDLVLRGIADAALARR